jgi:hypothetical protein
MPRRLTVSIPAERLQAASGAAGERPQFAPIAASDARPTKLIAGPLFYLAHAVWNYFGSSEDAIDLAALTAGAYDIAAEPGSLSSFTISRALAKIITFRVIASAMDFASNYFAVRESARH